LNTVSQQLGNVPASIPDVAAIPAIAGSPAPADAGDNSGRIKSSLMGNSRMMKIIPEFVEGLAGEVGKMTDLLERNDLAELQKVVHQLRGASGGYGFDPVTLPAGRAEESIRAARPLESITAEINSLISVIRRIDGYDKSKAIVPVEPKTQTAA
jgi:HPt (histidine-containing phosphotransfer) domain-containing protein